MAAPISPSPPVIAREIPRAVETTAAGQQLSGVHTRHSSLSTTLLMHDDMSALVSANRMRRTEEGRGTQSASSWVERILDDEGGQKLARVKASLLANAATSQDVRTLLQSLFHDASDMMAALRALLDDEELKRLKEVLREALADLEAEQSANGTSQFVKAGLNAAIPARLAAHAMALAATDLRDCYREFLGGGLDAITQYELWIDAFGFERRFAVVDFIAGALSADIYSLDPSCSVIEFGQMLTAVSRLRLLKAADAVIANECWRDDIMSRIGVDRARLTREILVIVRNGGGWAQLFDGCLSQLRFILSSSQISVLVQGFQRALRGIPINLWRNPDQLTQAQLELEELVVEALKRESLSPAATRRLQVSV